MLSKEKFIEYIEKYRELADIEEKLNCAVKLLCPDFNSFYLADWWMNLYMKGYWKCLSLKRKLKLI